MASFDIAIPIILKHEGGYSNLSSDKGGETYRGIARKWNPNWSGWKTIDAKKPIKYNAILPELEPSVKAYYKDVYWDNSLSNINNQGIANVMFDSKVQSGAYASIVKRALGDNIQYQKGLKVSSNDVERINKQGEKFYDAFIKERELYYKSLNQPANINGWMNRLAQFPDDVTNFIKKNNGWLFMMIICIVLLILLYVLTTRKGAELLGVKKLILQ